MTDHDGVEQVITMAWRAHAKPLPAARDLLAARKPPWIPSVNSVAA
jgi:hypothetical protein